MLLNTMPHILDRKVVLADHIPYCLPPRIPLSPCHGITKKGRCLPFSPNSCWILIGVHIGVTAIPWISFTHFVLLDVHRYFLAVQQFKFSCLKFLIRGTNFKKRSAQRNRCSRKGMTGKKNLALTRRYLWDKTFSFVYESGNVSDKWNLGNH